jgi:hypothetical protein
VFGHPTPLLLFLLLDTVLVLCHCLLLSQLLNLCCSFTISLPSYFCHLTLLALFAAPLMRLLFTLPLLPLLLLWLLLLLPSLLPLLLALLLAFDNFE